MAGGEYAIGGRQDKYLNMSSWYELIGQLEVMYVAPVLLSTLAHFLAEPWRWYYYLRPLTRIAYPQLFHVFSFTALLSYALPMKLGTPARVFLLERQTGLGYAVVSSGLVVDGLLYYGGWALCSVLALPIIISHGLGPDYLSGLIMGGMMLLLAVILCLRYFPAMIPPAWIKRFKGRYSASVTALHAFRTGLTPRVLFVAMMVVLVDIFFQAMRHGLILSLFNHPLPWLLVGAIAVVSIFAGLLSMMPMGLGGYDLTLVALLVAAAVPVELAVLVAVINRVASIAVSVVLGLWAARRLQLNPFDRAWWARLRRPNSE
jgi:uncharacterized membrane protein YbhN (UPF0104 family)